MPQKPPKPQMVARDSGITAAGSVTQTAGRDAAARDILHNTFYYVGNFLSGSSEEARYQAGQSIAWRRLLGNKLRIEYGERLDQVLGSVSGYPRPNLTAIPEAIPDPLRTLSIPLRASPEPVAQNASILQIYQRKESLLILGEPGAGKTTLLIELATKLLPDKDDTPDHLPVVAPLSTWERRPRRMRRGSPSEQLVGWLANVFEELYQLSSSLGTTWLMGGGLVLLLDGLDEIATRSERSSFLVAMNEYMATYPSRVVLTCRLAEYQALGLQAELGDAILVQPLEAKKVISFVRRQGPAYAGLTESLTHDVEMAKLCTSPLFLSMLMFTYRSRPIEELRAPESGLDTRTWLLKSYVDEQFEQAVQRGSPTTLPFVGRGKQRSLSWLTWLSQNLANQSQADFLLERMRPSWLPKTAAIVTRLCYALVLISIASWDAGDGGVRDIVDVWLLIVAILLGFTYVPEAGRLRWSLRSVLVKWRLQVALSAVGFLWGLGTVIYTVSPRITSFMIWPFGFTLNKYLTGIVIGSIFGEAAGIVLSGFAFTATESRRGSYEAIFSSLWTGTWVFAITGAGVVGGIFSIYKIASSERFIYATSSYYFLNISNPAWSQAIHIGVVFALMFAYYLGWGFVVSHLILRLWVRVWGVGPARYIRWLNAMVALRLMYRSGAGFLFMHRILQETFQSEEFTRRRGTLADTLDPEKLA